MYRHVSYVGFQYKYQKRLPDMSIIDVNARRARVSHVRPKLPSACTSQIITEFEVVRWPESDKAAPGPSYSLVQDTFLDNGGRGK